MRLSKAAEYCQIAYDQDQYAVGEVEYIVLTHDSGRVIGFRGTENPFQFDSANILDTIRDLRAIPWYSKELGWCHSGFLKGARKVWERDNTLRDLVLGSSDIDVVGHSLGGALALMYGGFMIAAGQPPRSVTTFGSPRTQYGKLKKLYDSAPTILTQVIHGRDPVTTVPWFAKHCVDELDDLPFVGDYARPASSDHGLVRYRKAIQKREKANAGG